MRSYLLTIFGLIFLGGLISCSDKSAPKVDQSTIQADEEEVVQIPEPLPEVPAPPAPEPPQPVEPVAPPVIKTIAGELQQICEEEGAVSNRFAGVRGEVVSAILELYRQREFQPCWFDKEKLASRARDVPKALEQAPSHALAPADYLAEEIEQILQHLKDGHQEDFHREAAWKDLALTLSLAALAYDLQQGAIPHQAVVDTWGGVEEIFDPKVLMDRILNGEKAGQVVADYGPRHPEYLHLQQALVSYRKIAESGGWQPIEPDLLSGIKDRELETGSHSLVPKLRERLAMEGYQGVTVDNPEAANRYDDALKEAVRQFQARRGLDQDGIVGPLTLQAMNEPVENLISKITWSMERWRWLPSELGDRFILVNIPEFRLRAYSSGQLDTEMGVIVGDSLEGTWTPIFADQMEYVIFRPYWNVPWSIIKGELLPEIKKDRGYLKKFNYEIVDRFSVDAEVFKPSRRNIERIEKKELKIRQTAGPYNALGLVKFIFPNHHSVYLHDTNQRRLFVHSKRDFSHGCIRVQDPEALARYALPAGQWTEEKIRKAMYDGERQMVFVGNPIPVYIFYLTAFADNEGPLGFFHDLYGYDAKMASYQLKAGNEPVVTPEPMTAQHP
jgi:murein L,D-transpeptidase YcbB/YkuD